MFRITLLSAAAATAIALTLVESTPAQEAKASGELVPMPAAKHAATQFIRLERNDAGEATNLQTAIVSYAAEGKGELVVDLVGAVHVGDKAYYEELNKAFEKYDVVLYELVAPEGTRVPKGGRDADNPVSFLQNMTKSVLELESQMEHVDYTKDNFVHADLSPQGMADAMKKRGDTGLTVTLSAMADMMRQMNLAQQKAERDGTDAKPAGEDPLLMLFDSARGVKLKRMMAEQFADPDQLANGLGPTLNRMLVEDRNEAAMKVFQKELAKGHKKIAIFYGAAHMPDFEQRLKDDFGLKPKETRWVTAWDMKANKKNNAIDPLEAILKALQDSAR